MEFKEMEKAQNKIMEMIDSVGIVTVEWASKELKKSREDTTMILEGLRRRGDLAGVNDGYARRKSF